MANTIKLKNASGSDPSASDLVVGEVALRTDNAALFTKKDDGSVAQIGASGVSDGDKGDITVSNSGATFTIDNDAVTFAKMQNIDTARILGRDTSGSGTVEQLTAAETRILLNIENGSTADQTASEIVALVADQTIAPSTIDMEDNEKIKLGGSDELEIFHNGSENVNKIDSTSGNLDIVAANDTKAIRVHTDGTVDIGFQTDNVQLRFGASSDLKIYHNTHSYIENVTGDLFINCLTGTSDDIFLQASDNIFIKPASGEDGIKVLSNGSVELYEDNVKRLETSTSGVNIIGGNVTNAVEITATGTHELYSYHDSGGVGWATGTGSSYGELLYLDENNSAIKLYAAGSRRATISSSGLNVTGNITLSGTVDGRDLATDGSKLDGIASGATNVTNTNQLTNGAGFITATLTNEQVQDIVGAMVSSNSESGITVTYQDSDGTLDFSVGTLNQNTTGNAATATKLQSARTIAGVSFDGSANISLNNNAITNGAGYITSADGGNAATLDGIDSSQFLRSDSADTASGDITFSGGAGAATIAANSDISFTTGSWTGNHCKIQHHSNALYIVGGTGGIYFREGGTDRVYIDGSGHLRPATNNTYDLGTSSARWRNVYTSDLNLSNEGSKNDVDGTYGSYTIQEGAEDLFLINRRNGKKYKFNLTEVN